jgi:hypothetical protein
VSPEREHKLERYWDAPRAQVIAECSCGWASALVLSESRAREAWVEHAREANEKARAA